MMLKRLVRDFQHNAKLMNTKPVTDRAIKTLDCMQHLFVDPNNPNLHSNTTTLFRATTKKPSERDMSFRWVDWPVKFTNIKTHDPYTIALANNLVESPNNSIVSKCYTDTLKTLQPLCKKINKGFDMSGDYGLEKIWLCFGAETSPESASLSESGLNSDNTESLPPALKNKDYIKFFNEFGVNSFNSIGFDFKNESMNFYCSFPHFASYNRKFANQYHRLMKNMVTHELTNFNYCSLFDRFNLGDIMCVGFTFSFKEKSGFDINKCMRMCVYYYGSDKNVIPFDDYSKVFDKSVLDGSGLRLYDDYDKNGIINGIVVGDNIDNYYGKLEFEYKKNMIGDFKEIQGKLSKFYEMKAMELSGNKAL
jgi:hypothetical protein